MTLCDWHNLIVKEGLTVYREQQFMTDLDTAAAAVTSSATAPRHDGRFHLRGPQHDLVH